MVFRWIAKLFSRPDPAVPAPEFAHYVNIRLNAKLQPLDRGFVFEDPLSERLEALGLGTVVGGGTLLKAEHAGIEWIDVEIGVHDISEATIATVRSLLERIGAPKGSELQFADRDPIPFGKAEGLGIFFDGTVLAPEVRAGLDVNETIQALCTALAGVPHYWGYWQGGERTELYFYAGSYEAMLAAMTPVLERDPLCENCRVAQIA